MSRQQLVKAFYKRHPKILNYIAHHPEYTVMEVLDLFGFRGKAEKKVRI